MKVSNYINCRFVIFFISFFPILLLSVERKITIFGDYIEYNTKTYDVIVKGNARAFDKGMKILADSLQANVEEDKIFAYGNVIFWNKNEKNTGEFIFYNMKTGEGYLKNAAVYRGEQVIKAREIEFSPQYFKAIDVTFTTCDNKTPDYFIKAKKIFVKYGDYSQIDDMYVIFKGKVIQYKKRNYQNLNTPPRIYKQKIGYTKYNGTYAKITYPFSILERSGSLAVSYYQKRGSGITYSENRKLSNKSSLNYSYHFFDDDKNQQVSKKFNLGYNLKYKKNTLSSSFNYSATTYKSTETNKELTINLNSNGRFRLPWNTTFLDYRLKFNDRIDMDGDDYTGDNNYSVLKRIPEVSIKLPNRKFKFLNMNLSQNLLLARYHQKGLRAYKSNKYSLKNAFSFRPDYNFLRKINLRLNEDWVITYYSGGYMRKISDFRAQMGYKYNNINTSIRYNKRNVFGDESPYRLDNERENESLYIANDYKNRNYQVKLLSTNYNFVSKRFGSTYSDLRISNPKEHDFNTWSFYIRANYLVSPDNTINDFPFINLKTQSLYSKFSLKPRDAFYRYGMDISLNYDSINKRMRDLNTNFDFKLVPKIHIKVSGRYDYSRDRFSSLRYDLNYDLHCFESKLSYNTNTKDLWIEFYLKANRQKPVKLFYDADKKRLKPIMRRYDF